MLRVICGAVVAALLTVFGPPEGGQYGGGGRYEAAAQAAPALAAGDNLVVEGIPRIPSTNAEDVRRYTEARAAAFADWHPTRRELLISTRFADAAQIHAVRTPGGARTQLTFEREPITTARFQPVSGDYFVFSRDTGGNEFFQLYRYDLSDGRTTLLTDGGRSQNGQISWSTRGDRIAYGSTRRTGADRDLYVIDPRSPKSDRMVLQVSGGGWGVTDWSPDDSTLLVDETLSISKTRLWLVDVRSGQKTALTPDQEVSYGQSSFSRDGRGVYVTTDKGSEFLRLAYIDIATKTLTPLSVDIKWDIQGFDLSPDGRTLAFVSNEAGFSKAYLLDTQSKQARPIAAVPEGVVGALKWHPNGRDLAIGLSAGGAPADVYSVDVRSGALTRWTESELGGITPAQLTAPKLVEWPSFDGRTISAFYYHPPSRFSGPRPVLINIHGGPESQYRPAFLGRNNYLLQEMGVAIIFPNVRGSAGYGKTFLSLDNGLKREDSVKDIGTLLDWIAKQPQLDASRVMVTGGSYGGYMTLAVATNYNDRIRAALDIVGISNFNTFLKNTESYRRDLRRVEYGDERVAEIAEFFERTAPLNNAGRINKPLFVVQGGNDPRVPRTESEQMVARVRKNGTPVWYLMAKDEGHGFAKKPNQDFQFYATVMFIRRHLLGETPQGE
jgi:dipeptidyl aminopeptidase/acylaminoacyl peptidase